MGAAGSEEGRALRKGHLKSSTIPPDLEGLHGGPQAGGPVTPAGFARFYAPLAATSLLLTSTNPILAAALGRSTDPVAALAGYGVAFSVCGVLYAPLFVVQQVAAARLLVQGSFAAVKRFAYLIGTLFSLLGALIAFTGAGPWVFGLLLGGGSEDGGSAGGVSPQVLTEAVDAMRFLWPVPLLTAVRSCHQGRLVAGRRTGPIAFATSGRTAVLAVVAFGMLATGGGAWLGAAAFTVGLMVETLVVLWSSTPDLELEGSDDGPDNQKVARFSAPLMLNVLMWWATPLIINVVLARTADPDRAIAAFGIVEAVGWFVAAPVGQLQHASIALVHCSEAYRRVRAWGGVVALAMTGVLLLLSLPGVRGPLLGGLLALESEPELLALAGTALPLAAAYPLLYAVRQYYQGLFVGAGRTGVVGTGAVLRMASIVVAATVLLLGGAGAQATWGAGLGVGLAVAGLMVEGAFLVRRCRSLVVPELKARRTAEKARRAAETVSARALEGA